MRAASGPTPENTPGLRGPLLFVVAVLAPAAAFVVAGRALGSARVMPVYPLVVFAPVIAAALLVARESPDGVARLARSALPRRRDVRHYALALCVFPLAALAAIGLGRLVFDVRPSFPEIDRTFWLALLLAPAVFAIPGIAEEPGWRGYLQPRLAARLGTPAASLAVGLTWGAWHASDLVAHAESFPDLASYAPKQAWIVAASLVLGALQRRSRGSLLAAMLGHFGGNLTFAFTPIAPWRGHDVRPFWLHVALVAVLGLVLARGATRADDSEAGGEDSARIGQ